MIFTWWKTRELGVYLDVAVSAEAIYETLCAINLYIVGREAIK